MKKAYSGSPKFPVQDLARMLAFDNADKLNDFLVVNDIDCDEVLCFCHRHFIMITIYNLSPLSF
jgi:hypothetical protein